MLTVYLLCVVINIISVNNIFAFYIIVESVTFPYLVRFVFSLKSSHCCPSSTLECGVVKKCLAIILLEAEEAFKHGNTTTTAFLSHIP